MSLLKKSEMTIEQMEQEITKAKANPLLPDNLKDKYVKMMEGRIADKKAETQDERLKDERGDSYSGNHIQLKAGKAYFAGMPIHDLTYNKKNKLGWYTVTVIGVSNFGLGTIVLSKDSFTKLAEIVNPRIITIEKLEKGGTIGTNKIAKVMHEFKEGKLKTSAGKKVKKPKQAIAIALSEQRAEEKTGKGVRVLAEGISKENKELIAKELARRNKKKMATGGNVEAHKLPDYLTLFVGYVPRATKYVEQEKLKINIDGPTFEKSDSLEDWAKFVEWAKANKVVKYKKGGNI